MRAAEREAACITMLLEKDAEPNIHDQDNATALHRAAYCGSTRAGQQLLESHPELLSIRNQELGSLCRLNMAGRGGAAAPQVLSPGHLGAAGHPFYYRHIDSTGSAPY
ncbi:hypothetical protein F5B17DRAFT_435786 [Nemania serpens]|nr:hypothetical protein F5B17DRAFT_435786 [Nemania serpens]